MGWLAAYLEGGERGAGVVDEECARPTPPPPDFQLLNPGMDTHFGESKKDKKKSHTCSLRERQDNCGTLAAIVSFWRAKTTKTTNTTKIKETPE